MPEPRRGDRPTEISWLLDELDSLKKRVRTLEQPSGGQTFQVVDKVNLQAARAAMLAKYDIKTGLDFTALNVSVTEQYFYYPSTEANRIYFEDYEIPTNRCLISSRAAETEIQPQGGGVSAIVSYRVTDAKGVAFAQRGNARWGRYFYVGTATQKVVTSISNQDKPLVIDPVVNPGPYLIEQFCGVWGRSDNAAPVTVIFSDRSLSVRHLEPEGGW